jgi:hypothetical protein
VSVHCLPTMGVVWFSSRAHLRRATPDGQDLGYASMREQPRESRAAGMTGGRRPGLPGISPLPGGSFARVLRTRALRTRRLPSTAPPPPAATGPRRNVPDTARHELVSAVMRRARCADRRAKGHRHRAGTPRIVRAGPSSVKGTRRSFLTALQKRSSGPALERWRPLPAQRA